jgi:hypothetical protein
VPFLRLTRDRRGFENTFLLHADQPGERPRLLYWYRTAPGIVLGRSPLDEDAIRTIEDQHPEIDFDWPAILALSEVMMPEDEAPARPPQGQRRQRQRDQRRDEPRRRPAEVAEPPVEESAATEPEPPLEEIASEMLDTMDEPAETQAEPPLPPPRHTHGLLEELVGREIATRLRARYSEISARIHERHTAAADRDAWMARAESLNPDTWLTPEAILDGVRNADGHFDKLRQALLAQT